MSYMLLIIEPEGQRATRTEAEGREAYAAMQRFGQAIAAKGQLKAVESLVSLAHAVRVTHTSGQPEVLDGPFAEAKEMIGGFFLLQNVTRVMKPWPGPTPAPRPVGAPWRCGRWRRALMTAQPPRVSTDKTVVEIGRPVSSWH